MRLFESVVRHVSHSPYNGSPCCTSLKSLEEVCVCKELLGIVIVMPQFTIKDTPLHDMI
jgi:hypothetical protein